MSDSILDRVKQDLTDAMKAQDDVRRRALRSLRAALANKEIAKRRAGADSSLEGQEELAVVQKQVKQRRDSIEQYEEADRDDLAQKEREEIEVLEDYLPDRLSDEELAERLDAIIDDVGWGRSWDVPWTSCAAGWTATGCGRWYRIASRIDAASGGISRGVSSRHGAVPLRREPYSGGPL